MWILFISYLSDIGITAVWVTYILHSVIIIMLTFLSSEGFKIHVTAEAIFFSLPRKKNQRRFVRAVMMKSPPVFQLNRKCPQWISYDMPTLAHCSFMLSWQHNMSWRGQTASSWQQQEHYWQLSTWESNIPAAYLLLWRWIAMSKFCTSFRN